MNPTVSAVLALLGRLMLAAIFFISAVGSKIPNFNDTVKAMSGVAGAKTGGWRNALAGAALWPACVGWGLGVAGCAGPPPVKPGLRSAESWTALRALHADDPYAEAHRPVAMRNAGYYTLALEPLGPTASEADSQTLFRGHLPEGRHVGFIVSEADGIVSVTAVADFHNVPLDLQPGTRYVWYADGGVGAYRVDGVGDTLASGVETVLLAAAAVVVVALVLFLNAQDDDDD